MTRELLKNHKITNTFILPKIFWQQNQMDPFQIKPSNISSPPSPPITDSSPTLARLT